MGYPEPIKIIPCSTIEEVKKVVGNALELEFLIKILVNESEYGFIVQVYSGDMFARERRNENV